MNKKKGCLALFYNMYGTWYCLVDLIIAGLESTGRKQFHVCLLVSQVPTMIHCCTGRQTVHDCNGAQF